VEKFSKLKEELRLDLGNVDIREGDVRKLPFNDMTIDGIVTSPPYSIAVNYIKQDLHALDYLNINTSQLVNDMIGLRGKGEERITNYFADMLDAFKEMHRVLKEGAFCVILIGDVTYNGKRLPIHKKYIEFAEAVGFSPIGIIKRPILGGFARLRYEYILMFQKRHGNLPKPWT
jgi:DNA modification methylase